MFSPSSCREFFAWAEGLLVPKVVADKHTNTTYVTQGKGKTAYSLPLQTFLQVDSFGRHCKVARGVWAAGGDTVEGPVAPGGPATPGDRGWLGARRFPTRPPAGITVLNHGLRSAKKAVQPYLWVGSAFAGNPTSGLPTYRWLRIRRRPHLYFSPAAHRFLYAPAFLVSLPAA